MLNRTQLAIKSLSPELLLAHATPLLVLISGRAADCKDIDQCSDESSVSQHKILKSESLHQPIACYCSRGTRAELNSESSRPQQPSSR